MSFPFQCRTRAPAMPNNSIDGAAGRQRPQHGCPEALPFRETRNAAAEEHDEAGQASKDEALAQGRSVAPIASWRYSSGGNATSKVGAGLFAVVVTFAMYVPGFTWCCS